MKFGRRWYYFTSKIYYNLEISINTLPYTFSFLLGLY